MAELESLASSSNELLFASSCKLWKQRRRKDASVVRSLSKIQTYEHAQSTPNEALALILDNNMSRSDYQRPRNNAVRKGCNLYPAYNSVWKAKELCLPEYDLWTVTDYAAEVNMQALVNHTALRLIECQAEVINSLEDLQGMTLRSKVGFDGSTGQNLYTQTTTGKENRNITDEASLFLTCFVPLQLS